MLGTDVRLPRRRFLALAAAATCSALAGSRSGAEAGSDVVVPAPYFHQGNTGRNSSTNCGPATVAAAIHYSGVASPSVEDVRAALGLDGPTNLDQWAWLLDAYSVPWYSTWSQEEMDSALRRGHVVVIAAWMADLSYATDVEVAWSPNWGQSGRYLTYNAGHALLVVGTADGGGNYLIHDPNVFDDGTYWYDDGSPKGAYRRYRTEEVWGTISGYGNGLGLAVAPPVVPVAPPPVKRIRPELGQGFSGPGGGYAPTRGSLDNGPKAKPGAQNGVLPRGSADGKFRSPKLDGK